MDLHQLTLQDLRILRSLYRTHSQKETALALGLSSPTLSRRIAEMRELFGDKLFVRYANTMMPTPFMVEHIPAVERLVEGMRDLCEPSWFDPSSHQEVIRIGCIDYDLFSGLSVRTALMVRKAAPGIALEFRYLDLEIESKLANGSLDMVIWYLPLGSPNIHTMTLRKPRPAVLVRTSIRLRSSRRRSVPTKPYRLRRCTISNGSVRPTPKRRRPVFSLSRRTCERPFTCRATGWGFGSCNTATSR